MPVRKHILQGVSKYLAPDNIFAAANAPGLHIDNEQILLN